MTTVDAGPPPTIVFQVDTARRVGAQLRYNGGRHLAEIRAAVRILAGQALPGPNSTTLGRIGQT